MLIANWLSILICLLTGIPSWARGVEREGLLRLGLEIPVSWTQDEITIEKFYRSLDKSPYYYHHAHPFTYLWSRDYETIMIASKDSGFTNAIIEIRPSPLTVMEFRKQLGPLYEFSAQMGWNHYVGGGHIHVDQTPFRQDPSRFVALLVRLHNDPLLMKLYNPLVAPAANTFESGGQDLFLAAVEQFRKGRRDWKSAEALLQRLFKSKSNFIYWHARTMEFRGITPATNIDELERRGGYLQMLWDTTPSEIPQSKRWGFTEYTSYVHSQNFRHLGEVLRDELHVNYEQLVGYLKDIKYARASRIQNENGTRIYSEREVRRGDEEFDRFFTLSSLAEVREIAFSESFEVSGVQTVAKYVLTADQQAQSVDVWVDVVRQ